MPIYFPAIAGIMKPKTALETYRGTYEGKGVELALITEGEELAQMIVNSAKDHRKTPVMIRRIDVMAQNAVGGKELYVSAFQMLAEGFPIDQRCDLYLEVEQGANQIGDEGLNPEANTEQTVGSIKFNVFDTCNGLNIGKHSMKSIHEAIDNAYNIGAAAVAKRTEE
jgi:hypothetical protein